MNEFNINLVGKEENIKKEEIFNNFDINYLPMNNLPISYFPLNNPELSNELNIKDIEHISGIRSDSFSDGLDINNKTLILTANNDIRITKDVIVDLLLVGGGGGSSVNSIITTSTKNDNEYYYITFKSSIRINFLQNLNNCDILIVGGGGAGGAGNERAREGGGGGAGGVVYIVNKTFNAGTYYMDIGRGGEKGHINGFPSSIKKDKLVYIIDNKNLYARGGGAGAYSSETIDLRASNGGSGGGGNHFNRNGGISSQENTIWDGEKYIKGGNSGATLSSDSKGGGGGGAGSAGDDMKGGDGILINITGTSIYYAGGGYGLSSDGNSVSYIDKGGGGYGLELHKNGKANTGGGGGGGFWETFGGYGGSGIIIIKFKNIKKQSIDKYFKERDSSITINSFHLKEGGGGGGGETKYIRDYNLRKGIYNINIGTGGTIDNNGKGTYIMKNNVLLLETKGGNKADGINGGASHKNQLGKGSEGGDNLNTDNSVLGELINIEGTPKHYGNGGKIDKDDIQPLNISNYGNGGNRIGLINLRDIKQNGKNGVFILKYKNNDIEFINKYLSSDSNLKSSIDIDASIGIFVETAIDNPNYKLLVYRNVRTENILKLNNSIICDILIVGGGGCGGTRHGGGGGGGAVIYLQNQQLNNGTYSIEVGWGGTSNIGILYGNKGMDSIITLNSVIIYKALGGGGGYHTNEIYSKDGGSGGGGGENAGNSLSDNKPVIKYGNNGGIGTGTGTNPESYWGGGGGGGASLAGVNAVLNGALSKAGKGGDGIQISITGTLTYYGGGGGGGVALSGQLAGSGGLGGGGAGSKGDKPATPGIDNTGGGGGGSGFNGGSNGQSGIGGSGIVIIRVKKEDIEGGLSKDSLYKLIDKDTKIINDIKDEFKKKIKGFENNDMPYNKFSIFPLVILIILFWLFIFLFLLKFVHHYFINIYLYILLSIIIFLLLFGSMWFLYSNNDL